MKFIEIKEEKYLSSLVMMMMGLEKFEVNVQTLFLIELIKEADDRGFLVLEDKMGVIMERMGMKEGYFHKLILRLGYGGHVRRDRGIVYLHPKYIAVKGCEGNFLITVKNSDKSLDEKK